MSTGYRLEELARRVGGRVVGDSGRRVLGVATLEAAGPDDLAFLTNPRYRRLAETTRAGSVLVGPGTSLPGRNLLEAPEPYLALAEILAIFHPPTPRKPGISSDARIAGSSRLGGEPAIGPFAVLGDGVVLGDRVTIGPGSVLGDGCSVGDDTVLMARVVLYPGTRVGARCLFHSGVVLGSDGFGFATSGGRHRKVPQLGRVVVEDDVEIGANTTVDRGTLGDTVIGRGTKIDDLVMVAHGVRIGADGLLAAQAGISGSTEVGDGVVFAGQSGAAGHLRIGDRAAVGAKSAVLQDVPGGAFVVGIPAVDHRTWKRSQAILKRLPEWRAELRRLLKRVEALEKAGRREE